MVFRRRQAEAYHVVMGAADGEAGTRARVLDPIDRISEVLFGLIMALTFTGLIGSSLGDEKEVRSLLIGAVGCNIAWGMVDGLMFVLMGLIGRGHGLRILRSAQSPDASAGRAAIRDSFDPIVSDQLSDDVVEALRRSLGDLEAPSRPRLTSDDVRAGVGVALLVFLSTLPIVVPFVFMHDAWLALRFSNAIAVLMLFACGFRLGSYAGVRPWLTGGAVALLGVVIVPITIALGG